MLQDRSLDSCLAQIFQQQPSQQLQHQSPPLQHVRSQHCRVWQVTGAVLTAPAPALSSKQHQLLYVNSRAAACPVLAQLLRDWFIKHVKTLAGQGAAAGTGYWVLGLALPQLPFSALQQPGMHALAGHSQAQLQQELPQPVLTDPLAHCCPQASRLAAAGPLSPATCCS